MSGAVIMALDLGVITGVAIGPAGSPPRSFSVVLKKSDQDRSVSFASMISFLCEQFAKERPGLVFKEAMLPLEAFRKLGNAEATVRLHAGLHAVVEGVCLRFGIEWDQRADSTIRRHFIGKARMGTRAATKSAVVDRCHLLKLLPPDCREDNRADAIAAHDWAAAHLARTPPKILHLFGGAAA